MAALDERRPGGGKEGVIDEPGAEAGAGATDTAAAEPTRLTTFQEASTTKGQTAIPSSDDDNNSNNHTADPEKQASPADNGEKPEDHPYNGRSKGKVALIMFALCMAVFLAALDVTIVTTALPTISEYFQSTAGYTWIGSAFLLANAASIPSWGKFSDIFGRKPMLLLANVIFFIGSLVAGLANSIGMLIAARAVQGLGGGGLVILVNITIGDLFSLRTRGAFYGVIGGVWAIARAIGPIIGGALTQRVSWRWCFYINLPLDGLAFIILVFFLDLKTPRTPILAGLRAVDWAGSLLIVGATLMFLFGLQYGGVTYPWSSATVLCLIIFGALTFVLFILYEWRIPTYPVMPLSLFTKRTNLATLSVVFLHGFVFISGSYYLPLYFQAVRGASPIKSGVYLLPTAVALSVGSIGTGIYVRKSGAYLPPIYFGLFMMTLGYGLFTDFAADSSWAKLALYQIIAGLGIGPLFQAPIIALQAHIAPRDIGTATATLGFLRQLATSSSVVIGEVVFQNSMRAKSSTLASSLGPERAEQLSGANAGANTRLIATLPADQRSVVRRAFANSLVPMWIMYTAMAAAALLAGLAIQKKKLTKEHEETKTGLEAEKENAEARKAEKEAKRASKRASRGDVGGTPRDSATGFASPRASHGGLARESRVGSGETLTEDVPPMAEKRGDVEMGGARGEKA